MATDTRKPTKRETLDAYREKGGKHREIVVVVGPGDSIGFRYKGTRKEYRLEVESLMQLAMRKEADRLKAEKKKARMAAR